MLPELFNDYVKDRLLTRQKSIIQANNLSVEAVPKFAQLLRSSLMVSSIYTFYDHGYSPQRKEPLDAKQVKNVLKEETRTSRRRKSRRKRMSSLIDCRGNWITCRQSWILHMIWMIRRISKHSYWESYMKTTW